MLEWILDVENIPTWILGGVAAFALRHPVWRKFASLVFGVSVLNIFIYNVFISHWSAWGFNKDYITLFIIAQYSISAIIVSWISPLPKDIKKLSGENIDTLELTSAFIGLLYLMEAFASIANQLIYVYSYNSVPSPNHPASLSYDVLILLVPLIQALIMLRGGIDGFKLLSIDIREYFIVSSGNNRSGADLARAKESKETVQ